MSLMIEKTIPMLPAKDFKETLRFYKNLGFVNDYENEKRSGGYAVLRYERFIFHLFAYKKLEIPTPVNMISVQVQNCDTLYEAFQQQFLENTQTKLKRTGLPKISLPRDLNSDRRFTITDPNGNHFFFFEPYSKKEDQSKSRLEKLYRESNTLAYSHESPIEAIKMMEKGIEKSDLTKEEPLTVFRSFLLLADMYNLLDQTDLAEENWQKTKAWYEKVSPDQLSKDDHFYFNVLMTKFSDSAH
ncbi:MULTISPECIES: hypothetical protein [unclassified Enterococcus]|jgi:hypothetical protein|uniref:hypothetical protein n=1 Tax=unclassified Enterococcus TaxID=2608891 RepID=UPI003D2934C2